MIQSGGAVSTLDAYRGAIAAAGQASAQHSAGVQPGASSNASADKSGSSLTADLGKAWNWTKNEAASAANAIGAFDAAHGHVLTRLGGAAQAVGGAAESVAGAAVLGVGAASTATGVGAAPGIPATIGGGALVVNGVDNAAAGLQTAWTGEFHHTLISQAAGAGAQALGASDQTAQRITSGVDLAQGIAATGASAAVGIIKKGAGAGVEFHGTPLVGNTERTGTDLLAVETGGAGKPHTIERHVPAAGTNSADAAKDRALNGVAGGRPPAESSFFHDLPTAQGTVDKTIADPGNQQRIAQWQAAGMQRNLTLQAPTSESSIGSHITRADALKGGQPTDVNNARVILKADPSTSTGYTVLSSYPTPTR
jgi:hypothetical protein